MVTRSASFWVCLVFLTLSATPTQGQIAADLPEREPLRLSQYTETTSGDSVSLIAREWRVPGGLILESTDSRGDRHLVHVNEALDTQSWEYRSSASETAIAVVRGGSGVTIRGTVAGDSVQRQVDLPESLWIQSIERSLRGFVLDSEAGDRLRFAVVQPDTLSARTLEARIMGDERITVRGEAVEARRVRISLPGIGVIIWRSNYWFRLSDGLFVQSRVTRGPPGTPETVVSLVRDGA